MAIETRYNFICHLRQNIFSLTHWGMKAVSTRTTRMPAFWDTPRHPMITHPSDSRQTPIQNKTKSKLQILKNCQIFQFWNVVKNVAHLLKLLDKMYKYEMDPTRTAGTTERTRDAGRTDRQTDGEKPIYPTTTSLCGGIIKMPFYWYRNAHYKDKTLIYVRPQLLQCYIQYHVIYWSML